MGLFVMVGGLVEVGVIDTLGSNAAEAVGDRFALAGLNRPGSDGASIRPGAIQ